MPQPGARAVEKFARAGEPAGLSVEDMIRILNAGVSVETVLDLIERSLQATREESRVSCRSSRWIM